MIIRLHYDNINHTMEFKDYLCLMVWLEIQQHLFSRPEHIGWRPGNYTLPGVDRYYAKHPYEQLLYRLNRHRKAPDVIR